MTDWREILKAVLKRNELLDLKFIASDSLEFQELLEEVLAEQEIHYAEERAKNAKLREDRARALIAEHLPRWNEIRAAQGRKPFDVERGVKRLLESGL